MLLQWLSNMEPVHRARTAEEREAVYRFRYEIYIGELKYGSPADHERKHLSDAEDERDTTTLLYTGSPEAVTSTVRVRVWEPGQVPPADFHSMSLDLFPGIERLRVAHVGRLMIRRTLRGKILLPSLLRAGYEMLAGDARVDLGFLDCVPGIVRHYRRLGAVPYAGRLVQLGYGPGIPLLLPISDYEHLRRCGSPVASLVKKYFGPGKRTPLDMTPFRHLIAGDSLPVELDPRKVWQELQESVLGEGAAHAAFLEELPQEVMKRLAASGFLLTVREGDLLTREGIEEREVYVVLEGAFEVLRGQRVGILETGEMFGEVAFFRETGRRTASVRALTPGRVLVLRRRFLEELAKDDAEAAFRTVMSMSRIMAERLAGIVHERDRPEIESP